MDIIALIGQYGSWSWVVGGIVLLAVELVVPGGVFVWLGLAAVVTGLATLVQPLDVSLQWGLFGVLSIASIAAWLGLVRRRKNLDVSDRPLLNQRAEQIVGQQIKLIDPISSGFGRVNIGDSTWRVSGPDLPAGTVVRVTGHDGTVLRVEAAEG